MNITGVSRSFTAIYIKIYNKYLEYSKFKVRHVYMWMSLLKDMEFGIWSWFYLFVYSW